MSIDKKHYLVFPSRGTSRKQPYIITAPIKGWRSISTYSDIVIDLEEMNIIKNRWGPTGPIAVVGKPEVLIEARELMRRDAPWDI